MNKEGRMATVRENKELVLRFVELINRGESDRLAEMMADGFRFIDIPGELFTVKGMSEKRKFWDDYFQDYPEYRIRIDLMLSGGTDIAFIGKTVNSHVPRSIEINETLLWYVTFAEGKVSAWRIFSTEGYAL